MLFQVNVTGRRISDNREYQLEVTREAPNKEAVIEAVDRDYDWEDAATRNILVQPVLH